jgi:FkbM family methyltransferase
MNTYSQIGQDLAVIKHYKNKRNGYFVEIGASDGIRYSNTYLLEKDFGWKGICVEALPEKFKELSKNRPTAVCVEKAVFNASDLTLKFDIAHSFDMLSGISNYITERFSDRVKSNCTTIDVQTITLTDLLKEANAPAFIDYLSLDTEGSEFEILKAHDFSKYKFGLIDVEHNYIEPTRTNIRDLLTSNGYSYKAPNSFDDCYELVNTVVQPKVAKFNFKNYLGVISNKT